MTLPSHARSSVTRGTIEFRGLRLSYLEWGNADRPAMVLLHGGTGAAAGWEVIASSFADRLRVIAPDARGCGYSDWDPAADYSVAATLGDFEALRSQLGLNDIVLVGHSFGAVVALVYAAREPQRVNRLVLVDGGPVPERPPGERRSPVADTPLEFSSWDNALTFLRARSPLLPERALARQAEDRLIQQPDGRVTWRADMAGHARWTGADDPLFRDQWPFVEALRCPTLVIRGGESPLFKADIARRMVEMSSHVRVVEVPGAGHGVPHEQPEAVAAAIEEFLHAENTSARRG
jgi:esterase